MQKILFDKKNAQEIAKQASAVSAVYNQLSSESITKLELLDAFAKTFGYKSGWAQFISVNKSERFYVAFSMSVCSHMRAIASDLSRFLPSRVDPNLLLIAVSFTELNVRSLNQIYKVQSVSSFESNEFVLWFTNDTSTPLRHLAKSPSAAVIERQGIYLKHFEKMWPELNKFIKHTFNLSAPEQVLLFERPIWWHYHDRFTYDYGKHEIGQWEIHFCHKNSSPRICYEPIYADNADDYLSDMATIFADGLSGCPKISHFGANMEDEKFVTKCLEYWESLPHIKQINFSLRRGHISKSKEPIFLMLKDRLVEHNETMDLVKNSVTNHDFTDELWGYESRFIYNRESSARIYQEPWLLDNDIKTFVAVNKEIHSELQNFSQFNLLFIGQILEIYRRERYRLPLNSNTL